MAGLLSSVRLLRQTRRWCPDKGKALYSRVTLDTIAYRIFNGYGDLRRIRLGIFARLSVRRFMKRLWQARLMPMTDSAYGDIGGSLSLLHCGGARAWLVGCGGGRGSVMVASFAFDVVSSVPSEFTLISDDELNKKNVGAHDNG